MNIKNDLLSFGNNWFDVYETYWGYAIGPQFSTERIWSIAGRQYRSNYQPDFEHFTYAMLMYLEPEIKDLVPQDTVSNLGKGRVRGKDFIVLEDMNDAVTHRLYHTKHGHVVVERNTVFHYCYQGSLQMSNKKHGPWSTNPLDYIHLDKHPHLGAAHDRLLELGYVG